MVVWDVGANVGLYTLCAARSVGLDGRVHAFEPVAENVACLRRHVQLNGLENVSIEERAVLDRDSVAKMAAGDSASEWRVDPRGTREVQAVALDAWRDAGNAPPPGVVKIDVEGAESRVLRGATRTLGGDRPVLYLSLHGETQRLECREVLHGLGYRVRSWEPGAAVDTTSDWIAEVRA
jgi:FkbM family methyltransferase